MDRDAKIDFFWPTIHTQGDIYTHRAWQTIAIILKNRKTYCELDSED